LRSTTFSEINLKKCTLRLDLFGPVIGSESKLFKLELHNTSKTFDAAFSFDLKQFLTNGHSYTFTPHKAFKSFSDKIEAEAKLVTTAIADASK